MLWNCNCGYVVRWSGIQSIQKLLTIPEIGIIFKRLYRPYKNICYQLTFEKTIIVNKFIGSLLIIVSLLWLIDWWCTLFWYESTQVLLMLQHIECFQPSLHFVHSPAYGCPLLLANNRSATFTSAIFRAKMTLILNNGVPGQVVLQVLLLYWLDPFFFS